MLRQIPQQSQISTDYWVMFCKQIVKMIWRSHNYAITNWIPFKMVLMSKMFGRLNVSILNDSMWITFDRCAYIWSSLKYANASVNRIYSINKFKIGNDDDFLNAWTKFIWLFVVINSKSFLSNVHVQLCMRTNGQQNKCICIFYTHVKRIAVCLSPQNHTTFVRH